MLNIGIQKKQGSIVEVLKEEILSGRITAGTEMTQVELASALNVSRMPVREALIITEYAGLTERLPNNHVRVSDLSGVFFDETFALCASIEDKALQRFLPDETDDILHCADNKNPLSLLEGSISDELLIHRRLCSKIKNVFYKKTLNTLVEIYIDYALKRPAYDKEKGTQLLLSAISAQPENRYELFCEYFEQLANAIKNERST